jgi:hypothetical protein
MIIVEASPIFRWLIDPIERGTEKSEKMKSPTVTLYYNHLKKSNITI